MEVVISSNTEQGRLVLTDNTPGQQMILRLSLGEAERDFHPWDTLYAEETHAPVHAAFLVHSWACDPCRSENGIAIARHFLRRWPEGPQAEASDLRAMESHRTALKAAARELAMDTPPLDKMSIVDRCILIRKMTEKLKDFKADSVHAYVLRMRISAAASLIQVDYQHGRVP